MIVQETVESWIQWSRANLSPDEDLPRINTDLRRLGAPWGVPQDLSDYAQWPWAGEFECLARRAADPTDVAARFTALHYCYAILALEDTYPLHPDDADRMRDNLREVLETIVRMVKVEDCLRDWRRIKWEVLNSYAIKDWKRARGLFDLAERESVLKKGVIGALRGTFTFLSAMYPGTENPVDLLVWEPRLFACRLRHQPASQFAFEGFPPETVDAVQAWLLLLEGLKEPTKPKQPAPPEAGNIRRSIPDLEEALNSGLELSHGYHCVLARAYFEIEDFHNASKHYGRILQGRLNLPEVKGFQGKPELYRWTARSYLRAGKEIEAQGVIEEWQQAVPGDHRAFLEMAQLHAQRLDYKAAYESFRKAVEIKPELESTTEAKIALALGGVMEGTTGVEDFLKELCIRQPEFPVITRSFLSFYWPCFQRLGERARKEWEAGIILALCLRSQHPTLPAALTEKAIVAFANAVEIELGTMVFLPFREQCRGSEELLLLANEGIGNPDARTFCTYLLDRPLIMLGQMSTVLDLAALAHSGIFKGFSDWLIERCPLLSQRRSELREIVNPRNTAAHGTGETGKIDYVHARAKRVLESVFGEFPQV